MLNKIPGWNYQNLCTYSKKGYLILSMFQFRPIFDIFGHLFEKEENLKIEENVVGNLIQVKTVKLC